MLLAERPGLDVVMVTAYATFDTAGEAIKRGAKDYLPKPVAPAQSKRVIETSRARRDLERRLLETQEQLANAGPQLNLETSSARMRTRTAVSSRPGGPCGPVLL